MASTLVSDKKFVELEGLKALIVKLGALREEYLDKIGDLAQGEADILKRLDALLLADTDLVTGHPTVVAPGKEIIVCIIEFIEKLRRELGDTPADEVAKKTVYERLVALEADCKQLNTRLETLETEAFTSVATEYDKLNNQIRVGFGTTKAEAVTAKDGLVDGKSFTIDTSDFVVDGLLGDVHSVTVLKDEKDLPQADATIDGNVGPGAYEFVTDPKDGKVKLKKCYELADIPKDKLVNGRRYLVFKFKVNETDGEGTATAKVEKDIWVDLVDLHDNFTFKALPADDAYIKLKVDSTHMGSASTAVTYTSSLGDKAVEDFKIVEGEHVADSTGAPGVKNRGVLKLDADLKAAEKNIAKHEELINGTTEHPETGLVKKVEVLEGEVRNGWHDTVADADVPGLLDRAAALEQWTKENIIPVDGINEYFDYWVMGDLKNPDDPTDPFKAAVDKRKETLKSIKRDFTQAPELK